MSALAALNIHTVHISRNDPTSRKGGDCFLRKPPRKRPFPFRILFWEESGYVGLSQKKEDGSGARKVNAKSKENEQKKRKNRTHLSFPSKLAQLLALASYGTPILSTIVSGKMIGRKLNVCGAIAVTRMTGLSG